MKKRAASIELYEAGVQIIAPGYEDSFGRFDTTIRYILDGRVIAKLADHFDIPHHKITETGYHKGEKKYYTVPLHEQEFEISAQRLSLYDVGNLAEVWAEVLAPGLIDVDIVFFDGPNGSKKYTQGITYSGAFVVDWAAES